MEPAQQRRFDRRAFILGTAAAATGLAVVGTPLAFAAEGDPIPPPGQWPYALLDPDQIGAAAWAAPGCTGCGGKSAGAIIDGLKAAVGWPWTTLPTNIGSYGNGGGPYGATCGGATGPFFIMTLVGAGGAIGQQFYKWYCDFAFPSTEWDAKSTFKNTVRTVSKSPLCHESRTIWENAFLRQWDGVAAHYDTSRCQKLYCDTTKQAVRMLNDWKVGTLPAAWTADADYATCYTCHTALYTDKKVGASYPSGRENCHNCHDVPPTHGQRRKRG
jgi:hypothetical protein